MLISSKTYYALKTLIHLAQSQNREVVRVEDIATQQNIPRNFLEQILLSLKAAGLVSSRRGVNGGYMLAMASDEMTLADVAAATDAMITADPGFDDMIRDNAKRAADIVVGEAWNVIGAEVMRQMRQITLGQLSAQVMKMESYRESSYVI